MVKAQGDLAALVVPACGRETKALDPDVPVHRVRTLAELVAATTAERRFHATLVAAFAGLGLVLAAVGIYGVVSHSPSARGRVRSGSA